MKILTILILTAATANATTYRADIPAVLQLTGYGSFDVTASIVAESDGSVFRFDSISAELSGPLYGDTAASSYYAGWTLDPFSIDVDLFSDDQSLEYVPGTTLAVLDSLGIGATAGAAGLFQKVNVLEVIDWSYDRAVGTWKHDALLDFGTPNEIQVQIGNGFGNGEYSLTQFMPYPYGRSLYFRPANTFTLRAIPEPSTWLLAWCAFAGLVVAWHGVANRKAVKP